MYNKSRSQGGNVSRRRLVPGCTTGLANLHDWCQAKRLDFANQYDWTCQSTRLVPGNTTGLVPIFTTGLADLHDRCQATRLDLRQCSRLELPICTIGARQNDWICTNQHDWIYQSTRLVPGNTIGFVPIYTIGRQQLHVTKRLASGTSPALSPIDGDR